MAVTDRRVIPSHPTRGVVFLVTVGVAAVLIRVRPRPGLWSPVPSLRVGPSPSAVVRVLGETVVVIKVGELVGSVVVWELGAGGVVKGVIQVGVVREGHRMKGVP